MNITTCKLIRQTKCMRIQLGYTAPVEISALQNGRAQIWDKEVWIWVSWSLDPRETELARPRRNCKVETRPKDKCLKIISEKRDISDGVHMEAWQHNRLADCPPVSRKFWLLVHLLLMSCWALVGESVQNYETEERVQIWNTEEEESPLLEAAIRVHWWRRNRIRRFSARRSKFWAVYIRGLPSSWRK
jgi:hypothetical protein